ncbi:MAG: DNA mismatch repair protein MutS [Christensenellales bacterium]
MTKLSPMMRQYLELKEQYNDCILMFRLGDFYEMFFEDAVNVSKELELTLTGRDCGLEERAPMCGVPFHSVEGYINRLIKNGHKVAICEQLSDPAESKGLVDRNVIRVITPGTVIEESMLEEDVNNYLVSFYYDNGTVGMAYCDVSTGEFCLQELPFNETALMEKLSSMNATEIICDEPFYLAHKTFNRLFTNGASVRLNSRNQKEYDSESAARLLLRQFSADSLAELGCETMPTGVCAAGALLLYLMNTQKISLSHINQLSLIRQRQSMILDPATRRNLELTLSLRMDKKGTLLSLLNQTQTSMGARLLRKWIENPLQSIEKIDLRLQAIDELVHNRQMLDDLRETLGNVYDIERLCSKISYGTINARDCLALLRSITPLPVILKIIQKCDATLLREIQINFDTLDDIVLLLNSAIAPEPPLGVKEGRMIKDGYSLDVDELRNAQQHGREWIANLEIEERKQTGIKNLKLAYNRVFGYYIEVTRSNLAQVPYRYIRKQTLANAERYITPELKVMEEKILGAEERCMELEYQLFCKIRETLNINVKRLQTVSALLAILDVLQSLALVSLRNNYCRPSINTEGRIEIRQGRHPVVEKREDLFVANDVKLDMEDNRFLIITGPNMAGKSTFMRQVALITLMAHMGTFVPAGYADIALTDRIFTRVGASDDLFSGQSTFMVEMVEVANILNQATKDSLLILDEIGRGTSTFDGLSIAWAVVEHISSKQVLGAKTLFATHYHELSELEDRLEGVKNFRISVKEVGDNVIFLRKIVRGSADKSFGIQVAKLAGVPQSVVDRAKGILRSLDKADINRSLSSAIVKPVESQQINLFDEAGTLLKELRSIDVDALSPLEALNTLYRLKNKANGE